MLTIKKELAIVEDLSLGFGTVDQYRDLQDTSTPQTYNKINASHIPALLTDGVTESDIQASLDEKASTGYCDSTFALLHGDASNIFAVATPVADTDASNKLYVDTSIYDLTTLVDNNYAQKSNVLELDNVDIYTPTDPYNPATMKYVQDTVVAIGAGDMAKGIYDTDDSGVVDNTEAVGGVPAMFVTKYNGVTTDANSIAAMNCIYDGTDVANTPSTGKVLILNEYGSDTDITLQHLYSVTTGKSYTRQFNGSVWSSWNIQLIDDDVVDNLTSTDSDKVLSANQGRVLNEAIQGISGVPIGSIINYSGDLGSLPSNWHICDGTNGTPNLTDRFIMGPNSSLSNIDQVGGQADSALKAHTHTVEHSHTGLSDSSGDHYHSASHNHSASSNNAGSHRHGGVMRLTYTGHGYDGSASGYLVGADYWDKNTDYAGTHSHSITVNTASLNTSTTGAHSHTITVNTATPSTSSTGEDVTNTNLPPYYVLAFIMKIS